MYGSPGLGSSGLFYTVEEVKHDWPRKKNAVLVNLFSLPMLQILTESALSRLDDCPRPLKNQYHNLSKKRKMKKYIFGLVAVAAMVGMTSCSTKSEVKEGEETGEVLKEAAYGEEGIANSEYIDRAQEVAEELSEDTIDTVEKIIAKDENAAVVAEKVAM